MMTDLNRRNFASLAALGGVGLGLSACVGASAAINKSLTSASGSVTTAVASVPTTAQEAVTLWGIAKGIAEVGLTVLTASDPGAAAAITLAISLGDTAVQSLPSLAGDIQALGTAVSSVFDQSKTLLLTAAGSITAIANKA
jgi:hypothetical protein